jgi:hypothetical protein
MRAADKLAGAKKESALQARYIVGCCRQTIATVQPEPFQRLQRLQPAAVTVCISVTFANVP